MPGLRKKKLLTPDSPPLAALEAWAPADILAATPRLVSPFCGLFRKLERVHKDLSEPAAPFIYRAEISNHRFMPRGDDAFAVASGKGFSHMTARRSALGEAIERYSAASWGEDVILRGRADATGMPTLDPARLVLFRPEQYAALKYAPYTPESRIGWAAMRSLGGGGMVAVPALAVVMAYETDGDEPFLFPITSNGLAAGATLPEAILSGAYEAIERDAFLATWLNRLPCRRIDPADHPSADIRALVLAHARRGVALELYKAPTDHGVHVFIGVAVSNPAVEGPAAVVGLGADDDVASAAASALIEACQVRPALKMRLRQPETRERMAALVADPMQVTTLEDHDLLYADHAMLPAFDFMRRAALENLDWTSAGQPADPICRLGGLVERMRGLGSDLLYANLTSEDVAWTGASVVRVVIPDFQPMHFGRAERRLAARRLYDLPQTLGFSDGPSTPETLNPLPHPLA